MKGDMIKHKMLCFAAIAMSYCMMSLCVADNNTPTGSDRNGTILKSTVTSFFSSQLPEQYRWMNLYTVFPENVPLQLVSDYPGVAKLFYAQAGRFLKPALLPTSEYIEQQLALIKGRPVPSAYAIKNPAVFHYSPNEIEDVAFLRYRVEDTDILICQTGGTLSNIYVTFLKNPILTAEEGSNTSAVSALLTRYFEDSFVGTLALEQQKTDALSLVYGVEKDNRKAKRFVCLIKDNAITFIIPKQARGVPPVASEPLANAWFETDKDRWRSVPLKDSVYLSPFDMRDRRTNRIFSEPALPPKEPASSITNDLDEIEKRLKGMPESDARYYCLAESQKLAEDPDANSEKLQFYMRGLGRSFDPPEVKVLRQILMTTKNETLRAAALHQLSKWITDDADSRGKVLRTLAESLEAPDAQIRQNSLRALGKSGDVRQLKTIMPLLDDADPHVQEAALKTAAVLLGWQLPKPTDAEALQQQVEKAKQAADSVMRSLDEAEHVMTGQKAHE